MRKSVPACLVLISTLLLSSSLGALDLQPVRNLKLPGPLTSAEDVRFDSSGSRLLLAAASFGLFSLPLSTARGEDSTRLLEGGNGARALWLAAMVASSQEVSAVAAPAFQMMAFSKDITGDPTSFAFGGIEDIDAFGSQIAVVGLRTDPTSPTASPDGAIAWTISRNGKSFSEPVPIAYALTGYGAVNFTYCMAFHLSAVKFLPDGNLILVPGAEPGVFRIDPRAGGRILQTWDTQKEGIGAPCSQVTDLQRRDLAGDPNVRWSWLNKYETVEDLFVLEDRPFMVTRRVDKEGTSYKLYELLKNGTMKSQTLPIKTSSATGHLRVDVNGSQLAFLQFTYSIPHILDAELFLMKAAETR